MAHRSIRARHTIDAVEAAYTLDGTDAEWLARLLETVTSDLDCGAGLCAFAARVDRGRFMVDGPGARRALDPHFVARLGALKRNPPSALLDELALGLVRCGGFEQRLGSAHPVTRHFRAAVGPAGFVDAFTLFAQDGEGFGLCVGGPSRRELFPAERTLHVWRRAGLHFAAALRLRRKLRATRREGLRCEALVGPDGRVAHVEGPLRDDVDARERLRAAVARVELARTAGVRRDPCRALELWAGLMDGRWSMVDRWESDGRRYIAVHANAPEVADPRALAPRERAVARYVALGASNKEIAFALGMPIGSVAGAVRRCASRLGGHGRADLIGFDRAGVISLVGASERLEVLRSEVAPSASLLAALSDAERAVLTSLAGGASNAAIASARGVSVHTIANQVYAIFRKLGVQSRSEALAKLLGPETRDDPADPAPAPPAPTA